VSPFQSSLKSSANPFYQSVVLQPDKGGDPSIVRASQKKRGAPEEIVEEVLRMYKEWTQLDFALNGLNKESNAVQKEITAKRKAKESADELMAKKVEMDKRLAEMKPQVAAAEAKMRAKAGEIGNIVGDKVPISQTEVSVNFIIRQRSERLTSF
jgi:seryl-tRNA synthetase